MVCYAGQEWTRGALGAHVGSLDQVAGIRPFERTDGHAQGIRTFQVWTGSGLTFEVLADRALGIGACHFRGLALAWLSPAGAVHPAYAEHGGLGWLRSYPGGLFVTGGLDHFGAPHDYADGPGTIHGRIDNLPARTVTWRTAWETDENGKERYALEVAGLLRQAAVFGENLLLRRRITTWLGTNRIRIEDAVTNEGCQTQRHMLLYHFNLGFPLLGPEATLDVDVEETVPHDALSASEMARWHQYGPPQANYVERNYWHRPRADADGMVDVRLSNPASNLALCWRYRLKELPVLLQWKNLSRGAYVAGVEPCNTHGMTGPAAPASEEHLPHLAPGETRHTTIDLEIVDLTAA